MGSDTGDYGVTVGYPDANAGVDAESGPFDYTISGDFAPGGSGGGSGGGSSGGGGGGSSGGGGGGGLDGTDPTGGGNGNVPNPPPPNGTGFSGNDVSNPLSQLEAQYQAAYNSALSANAANQAAISAGYQQTMSQQLSAQEAIMAGYPQLANTVAGELSQLDQALADQQAAQAQVQAGYTGLSESVLQGIEDVGEAQLQEIYDAYAMASGQASQDMVSRGLGNTTVTDSVQRGLLHDRMKAEIALADQLANTYASYESQLGLAGLGYQGQSVTANTTQANIAAQQQAAYDAQLGMAGLNYAAQASAQNTNLSLAALGQQASIQFGYPSAQQYQQIAQQYGMAMPPSPYYYY